jgi:hypothetical protein
MAAATASAPALARNSRRDVIDMASSPVDWLPYRFA